MRAQMHLHTFDNPDDICIVINELSMTSKCYYVSYLMISDDHIKMH